MSNNGWCGCACNNSEDNKQANYRQDKVRIEKP